MEVPPRVGNACASALSPKQTLSSPIGYSENMDSENMGKPEHSGCDNSILEGYRRSCREFPMETALGGEQALKLVTENGPCAVAVSDVRRPLRR